MRTGASPSPSPRHCWCWSSTLAAAPVPRGLAASAAEDLCCSSRLLAWHSSLSGGSRPSIGRSLGVIAVFMSVSRLITAVDSPIASRVRGLTAGTAPWHSAVSEGDVIAGAALGHIALLQYHCKRAGAVMGVAPRAVSRCPCEVLLSVALAGSSEAAAFLQRRGTPWHFSVRTRIAGSEARSRRRPGLAVPS